MENDDIIEAFRELALDILDLFVNVLKSDVGINEKVDKNTLRNSRLKRWALIDATEIPFIVLTVNDYIEYIESGRKPMAKKVPIAALKEWAMRKGIKSDNKTLYAIQQAIYRDGISPRPIMATFYEMLEKEWETRLADKLFDAITISLEKYFNS